MDFSTSEITPKKVRGSNIDFSTTEITLKKVSGNEVDFSISEITSKTYVKMTWKFVENWSWTYRLDIDIESTWIRRGVPVGLLYLSRSGRSSNGERYFYSRSRRSECSGTEMKIYVFCRDHGVLSVAAIKKKIFFWLYSRCGVRSSNGKRYFYSWYRRSELSGAEMKIYIFCHGHGVVNVVAIGKKAFCHKHFVVEIVAIGKKVLFSWSWCSECSAC